MCNWNTRAAARHFAHAAVLQLTLDELLRLRCTIHGELRPCRECRGLERLREAHVLDGA